MVLLHEIARSMSLGAEYMMKKATQKRTLFCFKNRKKISRNLFLFLFQVSFSKVFFFPFRWLSMSGWQTSEKLRQKSRTFILMEDVFFKSNRIDLIDSQTPVKCCPQKERADLTTLLEMEGQKNLDPFPNIHFSFQRNLPFLRLHLSHKSMAAKTICSVVFSLGPTTQCTSCVVQKLWPWADDGTSTKNLRPLFRNPSIAYPNITVLYDTHLLQGPVSIKGPQTSGCLFTISGVLVKGNYYSVTSRLWGEITHLHF